MRERPPDQQSDLILSVRGQLTWFEDKPVKSLQAKFGCVVKEVVRQLMGDNFGKWRNSMRNEPPYQNNRKPCASQGVTQFALKKVKQASRLALGAEPFVYNVVFLSFKTRLIGKTENSGNVSQTGRYLDFGQRRHGE